jgi:hypothetical protein
MAIAGTLLRHQNGPMNAAPPLSFALLVLAQACGGEPPPTQETQASVPADVDGAPERPAPRPPRFVARRELAAPGKPESVLAADLDGDGWAELVSASSSPGTLGLWRGSAVGIAREPSAHRVGGWPLAPVALPAGSFGAPPDVRPVALASREERSLAILDLSGSEPREILRVDLPSVPRALASGRIGTAGAALAAVATDEPALLLVGENGARWNVALAGAMPRCMHVFEDGSALAVGFQDPPLLQLLALPPVPGAPAATVQLEGIPRAIREVDLDGDGRAELVVAGGERSLWSFELHGAGGTRSAAGLRAASFEISAVPIDLALADLDGDGAAELVVLHAYDLSYSVLAPDWPVPRLADQGYAGQTALAVAVADLDGDRLPDLAIANRDSGALSLLSGDGRASFQAARHLRAGQFPVSIAAARVCGTSLPDLLVLNAKDDSLSLLANLGDGSFAKAESLPAGPSPRALGCADLDLDGQVDAALLYGDAAGSRLAVLFGDGRTLARRPSTPDLAVGQEPSHLLLADLDLDGRSDVALADPAAGEIAWLANRTARKGELKLDPPRRLAVGGAPRGLAVLQVDLDPALELAVAIPGPGARSGILLLDLDQAGALSELAFARAAGAPIDVAAADFDGDGSFDLAVLALDSPHGKAGTLQLLLRQPASLAFAPLPPQPTGFNPHHLATGDLDGDGLADVAIAAQNGHVVTIWLARRDAAGVRLERFDDLGAHLGCMDVALADLDGDGRLDIAVANAFTDDVSVILQR